MRQVKANPTGTFTVRFRLDGRDTSRTFNRRKDAQTFAGIMDAGGVPAALAWLDDREGGRDETLTFGAWWERYVTDLTGITDGTREDYRAIHRNHLAHLDPLPLDAVGRSHVATIVNRLDQDGRKPKTIKNVVNLLAACYKYAREEQLTAANPTLRVRLPSEDEEEAEPRFLTHDEAARLLAEVPAHYRPFVVFLLGTGLRFGEATALQSRSVDVAAGTVRVTRAWKKGKVRTIGGPKSRKSRRTVNAAVMALAAVRPLLGKPDDLVFTTVTGKAIRHSNFYNRVWTPAIERAGLAGTRVHDLRHTHASWLISDGIQLEAVQDQLGHESILTTRKVYGHLLPALGVAVGKSASEALARALPDGLQPRAVLVAAGQSGDDAH